MSKSEFFHPMMTPGEVLRDVSDGQNILIKSLLAIIIPCLQLLERTATSQLFATRYTPGPWPWMLLKQVSSSAAGRLGDSCTRYVSRTAIRSTGRMKRKKNTERIANPLAARPYNPSVTMFATHTG